MNIDISFAAILYLNSTRNTGNGNGNSNLKKTREKKDASFVATMREREKILSSEEEIGCRVFRFFCF